MKLYEFSQIIDFLVMSAQLSCFDHEDNEPEQVKRCEWDSEVPTKYCVFKSQKENKFTGNVSIDRGCADEDDIGLKDFYKDLMGTKGLSDAGCIICREPAGCKDDGLGELDEDDMVCFCKTDKCNQCEYRRTPCKQIDVKVQNIFKRLRYLISFLSTYALNQDTVESNFLENA